MPKTVRITPGVDNGTILAEAAEQIRRGAVVIFPTETVYGIGADLRSPETMERVFQAKGRPVALPLLAHCSNAAQLHLLAAEIPGSARKLMDEFWPGPLALIFRARPDLPAPLLGPGRTVGIRMVAHPAARKLIEELCAPIAGTSANRHGRPATALFSELDPSVLAAADLALDAGACGSGTASTVLDVTTDPPRLIRAGAIQIPPARIAPCSTAPSS